MNEVTAYVYLQFTGNLSTICELNFEFERTDISYKEMKSTLINTAEKYYIQRGYTIAQSKLVSESAYKKFIKKMKPNQTKLVFHNNSVVCEGE